MESQLPAPWMLGAKDINDIPMLICYMSNGELEGLDDLQGGPSIDEETGIREYSQLSEIIEIPEVKELFNRIVSEAKQNNDEMSEDVKDAYKIAKSYSLPYRETEEEEHNPLRALERKGRHGDSKLAYLPENFIAFLIELGYGPTKNPSEGLLEFWALNKLWGGHKKKGKMGHELLRVIG
ncbi:MAG TPA: hypothetical protein VNZ45_02445, partial [Bacteroidia bacterium]|nr:hypothetical protein [Bacteroidia bacterium]